MTKGEFKTIDQVWDAIESGQEVFWSNESYHLTVEDAQDYNPDFTKRNGKVLRVTCISNYFGSLLCENELSNLFIKVV